MQAMAGFSTTLVGKLKNARDAFGDEPIRGELYSVERLEQYAAALAEEHQVARGRVRGRRLLPRLEENGRKLVAAYQTLVEAVRNKRAISPAAEWLVDNFHIVEEQLREIREDLPKGYYYELPKLESGPLAGYPRIYAIATAIITHTDSRLDLDTLKRFIRAYQRVAPLTIGELWAVAITLRLALVENLRRLTTRIISARAEREEADALADKLLELAEKQPDGLVDLLASTLGRRDHLGRAFVVQLASRLRDQDPAAISALDWLEDQIARQATDIEQIVHLEHQRQAAALITVGNIITSMRLLSTLDWRDFFESVSLIDPVLNEDPAGAYARMDFASRDRYRHVIERTAKRTAASELEVARRAVELARARRDETADLRRAHVGYYLIDEGLPELEADFDYRPAWGERFKRAVLRRPALTYLGTISILTLLTLSVLLIYARSQGAGVWMLAAVALIALVPASDMAVSVLNWDITTLFKPRPLPKLDFSKGIPEDACTMVVVPTLLTTEAIVRELIEKLEVHYLANQDEQLFFALLGDFADAPAEEMPEDEALLDLALEGIAGLNRRYAEAGPPRFHLFHRRRQWNAGEGKWIGWERKRGKLHEFNRLLRGARDTSFRIATADPALLARIRYVITLDSDTQLPRDAARKLVGTVCHPLNRAQLDPRLGRVTRGYGILQPRVSVSLTSASRSLFARVFSGNTGIDPYTTAVSDVYQDLFCEGSYTGKGLYEVDVFEAALDGRVPENSLLSHDLFEGLFARSALVTDIELLDDYPAYYDTYAKRLHRWVRGDWQIARWLLPSVPDARGNRVRNLLPVISRWKIFDNLRRSLVAPAMFIMLAAAWTVLPGSPLAWVLFVLLALAFPVFAHVTTGLMVHPRGIPWTSHFWNVWGDTLTNIQQIAITIVFLAHQAYLMTDAITRTLYRLLVSRQHLLEWVTAAQAEQGSAHDARAFLRFMWPASALAIAVTAFVLWSNPPAIILAAPFVLAWAFSPLIADWISRREEPQPAVLQPGEERMVRLIARRTWRFFETFVTSENNWLSPDNYQESPVPVVAHRTSPTNIGLLFLSTAAAHDLGYIGTLELTERFELTFASMSKLERFHGHYLNWYDTRTLEPLLPKYVSTVDSGNLAGHLLAIKQVCVEAPDVPLFGPRIMKGFADTVALMREEASRLGAAQQRTEALTLKQLRDEVEACATLIGADAPQTPAGWHTLLDALARCAITTEDIINALAYEHGEAEYEELRFWTGALLHQTREHRRDLDTLLPWAQITLERLSEAARATSAAAGQQVQEIEELLAQLPGPGEIPGACDRALAAAAALREELERAQPGAGHDAALGELDRLTRAFEGGALMAQTLLSRYARLARRADETVMEMDFRFLFDAERKVFVIGYNVSEGRRDHSFYDLLASEARLGSFVAIAKGDAPQEHWFRLGRQLTPVEGSRALISWTATMFEYLMPLLVMRNYKDTLLDQTYRAVINRQIAYGREHNVPWGVSESAYNARDLHLNYQYGPFGIPGLGLKRGLSDDLVVSPYSTMLAALVVPRAALDNLRRLEREGLLTRYGFYEAVDYTAERLPQDQKRAIVHAFMTHHQGMSLVALDNLLHDNVMQRRFHAEPLVQATELLLQERIPRGVTTTRPRAEEVLSGRYVRAIVAPVTRRYNSADQPTPHVQLLSNGTYSVMVTTAGSGYSRCGQMAVTRWREDATRDHWGTFIYLRDLRSDAIWSAGWQPTNAVPQDYQVSFSEDKVEIRRRDGGFQTLTEIIVSPEDNAEVRRVSVTNQTGRVAEIELTSYAEVVLAPPAADAAHPAFSNLFIETEFFAAENALLARRRQRQQTEEPVWGVHSVVTEGATIGSVQYETDRGRFLGRGHTVANPAAIIENRPLSNTVGAVLDPIFALRQSVRLAPGETARVTFATAFARTRDEAVMLADKYHDNSTFNREASLAWTKSQVEMRHLNIDAEEAHLFQLMAGRLLYADPTLRPRPHVLALNTLTQAGLWPYGISGDLPILLVRISEARDIQMVRQIMRGHEYLRLKGLAVDLVILNDHPPSYAQSLQDELLMLIRTSGSQALVDKPGGVYLRRTDVMPDADKILLHAVARLVIVTERGSLEEQLTRKPVEEELPPQFAPRAPSRLYPEPTVAVPDRAFFNGLGGFSHGGREYVTVLGEGQWTPAPWLNVIANSHDFGFQVTETGAGYTWSVNSRENRLTPWSNDAVSDPPGEAIYLRDEDSGTTWTPTPLPIREPEPYVIRHGQGYTVFEHTSHGISQELLMFVPLDAPVKISLLRLRNRTDRPRRISVTSYHELVLGVLREVSSRFVITEIDRITRAVIARNPYNNEFAGRVAFADMSARPRAVTCDRKEFLGRNGSPARPAALRRAGLAGRVGAGLDPCIAMQTVIELAPGESHEIVIMFGEADNLEEARALARRFRQIPAVYEAFEGVLAYWDRLLETIEVKTPDAAMDLMLNRWLLYQALACRIWSRSAFYQSGGAYGFRDQLQDVMALVYARPEIAREQILRAAARQFKEGDVQHWWHPPTGRGVRTLFSDDLLWLPYVTSFYIRVTGDLSVLDEVVPFLEGPPLEPGTDEAYIQPVVSSETGTIYEHCIRALDRSLKTGRHGLPLMGSGDWNDGMNRVGHRGQGESVWVGWFLLITLKNFAGFCAARGQAPRAQTYREHAENLRRAIEKNAWDGDWYRRAYFDDGTPLGSAQNDECRIDSIVQSWGVISGAADPHRAARAMSAVEEYLIRRGDGLVLLFTPPFDKSTLNPGYIKGYVPGVRENGGQYTHAALWTLIAFAALGDGDRAGELFALLNPINHASTRAGMHKYKVEPYVAAGDVYAVWPHTGRGGWTWYTGSAGWMYRAGLESILGFQLHADKLRISPCIPRGWQKYEITYRRGTTPYHITVENPHGVSRGVVEIELDGVAQQTDEITLVDDGRKHTLRVVLGSRPVEEEAREEAMQRQTQNT